MIQLHAVFRWVFDSRSRLCPLLRQHVFRSDWHLAQQGVRFGAEPSPPNARASS